MVTQLTQTSVGDMKTTSPETLRGAVCDSVAEEFDELFSALDNETRRYTLYQLLNAEAELSIKELADRICDESAIKENSYTNAKAAVQHRHLPALEKADCVEYDTDARTATATVDNDRIHHLLNYVAEESGWE